MSPATRDAASSTATPASSTRNLRLMRSLAPRLVLGGALLGIGERLASVEERLLGQAQVRSGAVAPLERSCQSEAPVQLAVGPIHGVPGVGGRGDVAEDPLAVDVVLEPATQPRPGHREGFVGHLDHVAVAGHQAGCDQLLDELVVDVVGDKGASRHPAPHRHPVRVGGDETEHQVTQHGALFGRKALIDILGRLRHRPADAAGVPVTGDGECPAIALLPRLAQGVGEQGKGPGFSRDLADQQLDEARLQQQPGLVSRPLDGGAQVGLVHRAEQVQAALDESGERRVGRKVGETVGAHRHHQRASLDVIGQRREESGLLVAVLAQRQRLFALVDDQHRVAVHGEPRERVDRMGARRHHHDTATRPLQGGRDPGANERRLARTRRPDDGEHAGRSQPAHTLRDLEVAPEEALGVTDVIGHQTEVRARQAGLGGYRLDHQGRVLAQDRLLHRNQLRPRIQTQLGCQHGSCLTQRPQRLALAAGQVLGQGHERPAPFAQRRLCHPGLGLPEHLPVPAALQARIDVGFLGVPAQLVQSSGLGPPRLPLGEIDQRPPSPQRQGLAQHVGGPFLFAQASTTRGPAPPTARTAGRRSRPRATTRR